MSWWRYIDRVLHHVFEPQSSGVHNLWWFIDLCAGNTISPTTYQKSWILGEMNRSSLLGLKMLITKSYTMVNIFTATKATLILPPEFGFKTPWIKARRVCSGRDRWTWKLSLVGGKLGVWNWPLGVGPRNLFLLKLHVGGRQSLRRMVYSVMPLTITKSYITVNIITVHLHFTSRDILPSLKAYELRRQ